MRHFTCTALISQSACTKHHPDTPPGASFLLCAGRFKRSSTHSVAHLPNIPKSEATGQSIGMCLGQYWSEQVHQAAFCADVNMI